MPNFPVLAGQKLRAGDFPYRYVKFKSGTEAVTNSAVAQDDNDLFADLTEGVWEVNAYLGLIGTTNTPDVRTQWSVTGTISKLARGMHSISTGATAVNGAAEVRMQTQLGLTTAANSGVGSSTEYVLLWEHIVVECTVPGRLQLQWAQGTATAATTTTMGAESHIIWQRMVEL